MFLQEKIREINEKFKVLEKVPHIAVWGAGIHTCKLFEKTNLLSYSIETIVDIDEKKQGNFYFGCKIKNPKEINWDHIGAVVISVPNKEKEIINLLINEIGFNKIIIKLYENSHCSPFYNLFDKNIDGVCYMGDYRDWESARKECKGYNDEVILEKVIQSTRKVLSGEAVWERDGYLFYEKKYNHCICAAILRCAVQNDNQGVRILDIGGALGSTYFQNKGYLSDIKNFEYVVAEQDSFAEYGEKNLEDGVLKFIKSSNGYKDCGKFDIVLMSASLQYIPEYREIILQIINLKPYYIILDRILVSERVRICKEDVPEKIYKSSYPVMIFTESEIIKLFENEYDLVEEDISSVPEEAYFVDGKAQSKLFVFIAKDGRGCEK